MFNFLAEMMVGTVGLSKACLTINIVKMTIMNFINTSGS